MSDQRTNVFLWLGYAIVFFIVMFLTGGIFSRFPLLGSVPNCLPVAVAFVAVLEGRFFGSVYGIGTGLFFALTHSGQGAGMILVGALIGAAAGGFYERRLRRYLGPCMVSALLALLASNLITGVLALWLTPGATLSAVLRLGGGEVLYSILLALPVYPLFLFVHKHMSNG